MSVDFSLVCDECRAWIHVGQTMAGNRFTGGFGEKDRSGQEEVGEFLLRHPHGPLKFMNGQDVSDEYKDEGSP